MRPTIFLRSTWLQSQGKTKKIFHMYGYGFFLEKSKPEIAGTMSSYYLYMCIYILGLKTHTSDPSWPCILWMYKYTHAQKHTHAHTHTCIYIVVVYECIICQIMHSYTTIANTLRIHLGRIHTHKHTNTHTNTKHTHTHTHNTHKHTHTHTHTHKHTHTQ